MTLNAPKVPFETSATSRRCPSGHHTALGFSRKRQPTTCDVDRSRHDLLHVPHAGVIWLVLAALVGVAGLAVAIRASRRGHELAGILACAVTGLLISPVSWIFHWVWCIPLLLLWAVHAWRGNRPAQKVGVVLVWLAFLASSCWIVLQTLRVPHPDGMATLFGNYLYVIVGAGALAAIALLPRRVAEVT